MYELMRWLFVKRWWIISYFDIIMVPVNIIISHALHSFVMFFVLQFVESIISNLLMWFFGWHVKDNKDDDYHYYKDHRY
jgi:hypothetical protein